MKKQKQSLNYRSLNYSIRRFWNNTYDLMLLSNLQRNGLSEKLEDEMLEEKSILVSWAMITVQDWMGELYPKCLWFRLFAFSLGGNSISSRYTLPEHKWKAYMKWSSKLKETVKSVTEHPRQNNILAERDNNFCSGVFSPLEPKVSLQLRTCRWSGCGTEKAAQSPTLLNRGLKQSTDRSH